MHEKMRYRVWLCISFIAFFTAVSVQRATADDTSHPGATFRLLGEGYGKAGTNSAGGAQAGLGFEITDPAGFFRFRANYGFVGGEEIKEGTNKEYGSFVMFPDTRSISLGVDCAWNAIRLDPKLALGMAVFARLSPGTTWTAQVSGDANGNGFTDLGEKKTLSEFATTIAFAAGIHLAWNAWAKDGNNVGVSLDAMYSQRSVLDDARNNGSLLEATLGSREPDFIGFEARLAVRLNVAAFSVSVTYFDRGDGAEIDGLTGWRFLLGFGAEGAILQSNADANDYFIPPSK